MSRYFHFETLKARALHAWQRVAVFFKDKGWHYWLIAAAVLALSVYLTPILDNSSVSIRYALFQRFSEWTAHPLRPRFIRLVMVGDKEYYGKELASRVPFHRDYMAKLVDALDRADVAVIALDFQMHLPIGSKGSLGDYDEIPEPYRAETDLLMKSIAHAALSRAVVLPKELTADFEIRPDYFQPYGICTKLDANGRWENPGTPQFPLNTDQQRHISCGYISLPKDLRQIAPLLDVGQDGPSDSFSLALARAWSPYDAADVGDQPVYGSYINEDSLNKAGVIVSADALLAGDKNVLAKLRFKPVLIGSRWHTDGGFGAEVDQHYTPIGWTNGAIIHENFAEAILSGRLYAGTPDWVLHTLEILFGIGAALLFAAYSHLWVKVALFFGLAAFLFVVQWLMFQLVGTFFEALFPLLGLAIHSIVERLIK